MVRVSVIVPVYNAEAYLARCLDSLCAQTLQDIEIICVNDGSTDGSGDILADYAERFPQVVVLEQENQGVSAARNAGMDAARGEYIGFCDADDWVDSQMYELLLARIGSTCSDMVMCEVVKVYLDGRVSPFQDIEEDLVICMNPQTMQFAATHVVETVWNKLFCMQTIRDAEIRFRSRNRFYSEDFLFVVEFLLCCDSIATLDRPLYYYSQDAASFTHCFEADKTGAYLCLLKYLRDCYGSEPRYHTVEHVYFVKLIRLAFGHARVNRLSVPTSLRRCNLFQECVSLAWRRRKDFDLKTRLFVLILRARLDGLFLMVPCLPKARGMDDR